MFQLLSRGINGLTWLAEVLAEIALAGLMLLVFHEVIVRYLFNSPTVYSVELSEYLLVVVAFMSMGWVLKEDRHVRATFVVNALPEKIRLGVDIVTSLLTMIFGGILVWKGTETAITAFTGDYHSSSLLDFPLWIPYAIIPLGALILNLQYIVRIGDRFSALTGKPSGRPETT
ncbi:MAG: TRAP transporter small permease [Desulfobacterales bacterium]|nr:TRAP transporter small permease [Desulfobacterales bacterium]